MEAPADAPIAPCCILLLKTLNFWNLSSVLKLLKLLGMSYGSVLNAERDATFFCVIGSPQDIGEGADGAGGGGERGGAKPVAGQGCQGARERGPREAKVRVLGLGYTYR